MIVPATQQAMIRALCHQFCLYRLAADTFQKRKICERSLQGNARLAQYLLNVLIGYIEEAEADKSSSEDSWRSACIDFHFAMALEGNAYLEKQQVTALKKIKRTWNDFKQKKKKYAPVENRKILLSIVELSMNNNGCSKQQRIAQEILPSWPQHVW